VIFSPHFSYKICLNDGQLCFGVGWMPKICVVQIPFTVHFRNLCYTFEEVNEYLHFVVSLVASQWKGWQVQGVHKANLDVVSRPCLVYMVNEMHCFTWREDWTPKKIGSFELYTYFQTNEFWVKKGKYVTTMDLVSSLLVSSSDVVQC
jgi:hypothetical protein